MLLLPCSRRPALCKPPPPPSKLTVFALRDIDMTKIESRPMRSNPILTVEKSAAGDINSTALPAGAQRFNYLFYVDFVGTLAEPRCQNALRHLQVRTACVRLCLLKGCGCFIFFFCRFLGDAS